MNFSLYKLAYKVLKLQEVGDFGGENRLPPFPGFMSVAVFVTDQKYTENFETKNVMKKKKDKRPSVQKSPNAAIA